MISPVKCVKLTRDQARVLLRLRYLDKQPDRFWLTLDVFPSEPDLRRAAAELLRAGILRPGPDNGVAITPLAIQLVAEPDGLRCYYCGDVMGHESQCSMCGRGRTEGQQ